MWERLRRVRPVRHDPPPDVRVGAATPVRAVHCVRRRPHRILAPRDGVLDQHGEYGCPTKVKTATVSSYTQGSVTLEPGGLYYASEWTAGTSQGEWDTPKVCLPSGADCMTIGGVDAGDHCMVSFSPDAQSIHVSPGTPYSVAGSSVTFYGDSSGLWGSRTFDFCVSGNTLRLRAQSVNGATLFDEVTVFGK